MTRQRHAPVSSLDRLCCQSDDTRRVIPPARGDRPELPDRLHRYVTEGADAEILDELERMPDAVTVLGLKFLVGGILRSGATPLPIDWVGVLEHAAELPAQVLLRLAKVMAAPFGPGQLTLPAWLATPSSITCFPT